MLTSILKSILFVCWKKGYNTVQYGLENRDTGSQKSTVQTQHTYSNFIKIRYSKKGGKYIISFKVLSFLRDYTVCFCHRRWNHPVELSDEDLKSGREEDFFTLKLFSSISVAWFCLFFRNLPPKSPVKQIITGNLYDCIFHINVLALNYQYVNIQLWNNFHVHVIYV